MIGQGNEHLESGDGTTGLLSSRYTGESKLTRILDSSGVLMVVQ